MVRRNLQREYLKDLSAIVLGKSGRGMPPDARSRRTHALAEINNRIAKLLTDKQLSLDDTTRAHLDECQERICQGVDGFGADDRTVKGASFEANGGRKSLVEEFHEGLSSSARLRGAGRLRFTKRSSGPCLRTFPIPRRTAANRDLDSY